MSAVAETPGLCVDAAPYPGATWFDRDDAWKFHGRDVEVAQLESVLIASRIVLLYSPSGAGKTSLLNAALIPRFDERKFQILPVVRVNEPPDGSGRNRYLVSALTSLGATPESIGAEPDLAGFLDSYPRPDDREDVELLVFDQFEEILTLDSDDLEAKLEFFRQVGAALRDRRRWAVFAMREDYIAGLDPYRRFIPSRLATTFRLNLLGTDAAMRAIQQPALRCGVRFTDAAAAALVQELSKGGPYVEPVQLQVVCRRIWDALDPGQTVIEADDRRITGANVDTALAEHYQEQIARVAADTGIPEYEIREWFDTRLISPQGIRTLVLLEAGAAAGMRADAVRMLIDAYLLRTYAREHAIWVELAHDRLVAPVRESNRVWKEANLRDWQRQAIAWDDQHRPPALLLAPALLPEAERWAAEHGELVTRRDRDFLKQSAAARDAVAARARSRLWWRLALAAVALLLLLGPLSVWALYQQDAAQKAEQTAEAERGIAENAQRTAEAERGIAQEERDRTRSHLLASQSVDTTGTRLDLSLLLSLEAIDTADTASAEGSLLGGLSTAEDVAAFLRGHTAQVRVVEFSPDGTVLVTADRTGTITLWSALTGMDLGLRLVGPGGPIQDLAFVGEGGGLLAGVMASGEIYLWDLGDVREIAADEVPGMPLPRAEGSMASPLGIAGDPRNVDRLAAVYGDGTIRIWDIEARQAVETFGGSPNATSGTGAAFGAVAYTPDGVLVSAGTDRVVRWEGEAGDRRPVVIADIAVIELAPADGAEQAATDQPAVTFSSMALSPDGTRVAAGTTSGAIFWWEVASGEELGRQERAHLREVSALAFSHDGQTLASGSPDRRLRLWDHQTGQPAGMQLTGYAEETHSLAFQPPNPEEPVTVWYRLVSGHGDGTVVMWNTISIPWLTWPLDPDDSGTGVESLVFAEDGASVLAARQGGTVERWGTDPWSTGRSERMGATLLDLPEADDIRTMTLGPNGTVLAVGGCARPEADGACREGAIWLLDVATGARLGDPIAAGNDWVTGLAFSSDGSRLVASTASHEVLLCDVTRREVLHSARGRSAVTSVAATEGGELVAWGETFGNIGLWRPAEDRITYVSLAHEWEVGAVTFSPDGSELASVGRDGTVKLWNTADGTQAGAPIVGEHGAIDAIAFSPDGTTLAAAARDRTVTLWDLTTRMPVAPAMSWSSAHGELGQVTAIAFGPDGRHLALAGMPAPTGISFGSPLVLVNLDPQLMRTWACTIAGRNLTAAEASLYLEGEDEAPACVIGVFRTAVQQARAGDREGAEATMREAVDLARASDDPWLVTQICWEGTLRGFAEIVLPACERGVELAPADGNMRYNRGLALAVAGDLEAGAADLEASIELMEANGWQVSSSDQRAGWIEALRAGDNPFDAATLRGLRFEYLEQLVPERGAYRSQAYGFSVAWDPETWMRMDVPQGDSGRVELWRTDPDRGNSVVYLEGYTAAGIDPQRCLVLMATRNGAVWAADPSLLPRSPIGDQGAAGLFGTESGAYLYVECRPLNDGEGMLAIHALIATSAYEEERGRLEDLLAGISDEPGSEPAGEGI